MQREAPHGTVLLGLLLSVVACGKASSSAPDAAGPSDGVFIRIPDASLPVVKDTADAIPTPCGNGVREGNEDCDDGNTVDGDGCSSRCYVESDFTCPVVGQPCIWLHACGNGMLSPGEACDDGNTVGGDGCAADCKQVEPGWRCRVPGKPCLQPCAQDAGDCADGGTSAGCGNGIVEPGEECDDGADPGKSPHNGDGRYGGCTRTCTWGAFCGDGVIDGPERCDDGPANGDLYGQPGCTFACTPAGYCGDGIVDVDHREACDFGPDTGKDPCVCNKECRSIQCLSI